jgi:hypothetical protein
MVSRDDEVAKTFLEAFGFWLFLLTFVLEKYAWYKICSLDIALSNDKKFDWFKSWQYGLTEFDIFVKTFASYVTYRIWSSFCQCYFGYNVFQNILANVFQNILANVFDVCARCKITFCVKWSQFREEYAREQKLIFDWPDCFDWQWLTMIHNDYSHSFILRKYQFKFFLTYIRFLSLNNTKIRWFYSWISIEHLNIQMTKNELRCCHIPSAETKSRLKWTLTRFET